MGDNITKGRWCNLPYYLLALAALMAGAAAATFYFGGGTVQRSLHAEGTEVTLYPTGNASVDTAALRDAVVNYEIIKLAAGSSDFVLGDSSGATGVLDFVLDKPTVVQALDPADPPTLRLSSDSGLPGINVNSSGAEVTLKNLEIESATTVMANSFSEFNMADVSLKVAKGGGTGLFVGASAGDIMVRDCYFEAESGTETYGVFLYGTAGDLTFISNEVKATEPIMLIEFSGDLVISDNDLTVTGYSHFGGMATGLFTQDNAPDSSLLLNRNRITYALTSAPGIVPVVGLMMPQSLWPVKVGNGSQNKGGYNINVHDLTVNSPDYPIAFGVGMGKTTGSSVSKLKINAEVVGYDFTVLGLGCLGVQEMTTWPLYEPYGPLPKGWQVGMLQIGAMPPADVLFYNGSHDNTVVSTGQDQYTVYDQSEYTATNPAFAAWLAQGNNAAVVEDWGYIAQAVWQMSCHPYNSFLFKYLCGAMFPSAPFCQERDWSAVTCELTGRPPQQFVDATPDSYGGDNELVGVTSDVAMSKAKASDASSKVVGNPFKPEDAKDFGKWKDWGTGNK